jgi:hypothetical protein
MLPAVDKKHWQSCCQRQSNHSKGDNPHEKHDLLLFDGPKYRTIKEFVRTEQRVGEGPNVFL